MAASFLAWRPTRSFRTFQIHYRHLAHNLAHNFVTFYDTGKAFVDDLIVSFGYFTTRFSVLRAITESYPPTCYPSFFSITLSLNSPHNAERAVPELAHVSRCSEYARVNFFHLSQKLRQNFRPSNAQFPINPVSVAPLYLFALTKQVSSLHPIGSRRVESDTVR